MSVVAHRDIGAAPTSQLGPVGWIASGELGYHDWLQQGSRLGLAGRNAAWWIGDWVRYGTARYGTKYSAAERVTGYDRQTLMNMVYVATRFEISRRRENLSWSHHAEVAPLDEQGQDRWLNRAVLERLSVRDLREELASCKRAPARATPRAPTARAAERDVTCPHCGHHFAA